MKHESKQFITAMALKRVIKVEDPFPQIVEIHPSPICNNKCIYCFNGSHSNKTVGRVLNIAEYRRLFSELRFLKIKNLSISGGGEPTLYEKLSDLIRIAKQHLFNIRIVTNGNLINEDFLRVLHHIDELRFSIDAISPKVYSMIRGVPLDCFPVVINNLKHVIKLRNENNFNVEIGVTFLVNHINQREVKCFCEEMLRMGVDHIILKTDIYGSCKINIPLIEHIIKSVQNLKSEKIELREMSAIKAGRVKCFIPYFKVAVNSFGKVYSCCLAAQPGCSVGYELGELRKFSFGKIWKMSREKRLSAMTNGIDCLSCNYTDVRLNNLLSK